MTTNAFVVESSGYIQLTRNDWLHLGPCGIRINMKTGEVEIPAELSLTEASTEFWKTVGLVNKGFGLPGEFTNR